MNLSAIRLQRRLSKNRARSIMDNDTLYGTNKIWVGVITVDAEIEAVFSSKNKTTLHKEAATILQEIIDDRGYYEDDMDNPFWQQDNDIDKMWYFLEDYPEWYYEYFYSAIK